MEDLVLEIGFFWDFLKVFLIDVKMILDDESLKFLFFAISIF